MGSEPARTGEPREAHLRSRAAGRPATPLGMLFPQQRPRFSAALRDVGAKGARARALAAATLSDPPEGREEEAKEALRTLADDASAEVRGAALAGLGRLRDEGALDLVLARFDDGDPMVRQIAIIAAAEIGDRRAVDALEEALSDARPDVRFQAVASLATLAPEEAAGPLAALAEDPDPEVRAHLADALGSLERPEAREPLARMLKDASREVRRAAAIGLARAGDARGASVLVDALDDRERCFEAAWALGELRVEEAREPLARVAGSLLKPLAAKAAAAAALVRLDDPRGVPALRAVLTALRSDARSYAVQLVGELRLAELAGEVAALVDRPRGADPVVVAEALGRMAAESPRARSALAVLARRDDEAGRAARACLEAEEA